MATRELPPDGWNEYKRLVLAELERLNNAVEKLREQSVEADKSITKELANLRTSLIESLTQQINKGDRDIKKAVDALEIKLSTFTIQSTKGDKASSSWGFWASIVTMVTAVIAMIVSLIVALS